MAGSPVHIDAESFPVLLFHLRLRSEVKMVAAGGEKIEVPRHIDVWLMIGRAKE